MKTSIWSLRRSYAWGLRWIKERECCKEEAEQWLSIFEKDEPEVTFIVSDKIPKEVTVQQD